MSRSPLSALRSQLQEALARCETLEAERAEQWRLRREAESSRDVAKALAGTFEAERGEAVAALERTITAWEILPGGRQQSIRDVEKWLIDSMAPAINELRALAATRATQPAGKEKG